MSLISESAAMPSMFTMLILALATPRAVWVSDSSSSQLSKKTLLAHISSLSSPQACPLSFGVIRQSPLGIMERTVV